MAGRWRLQALLQPHCTEGECAQGLICWSRCPGQDTRLCRVALAARAGRRRRSAAATQAGAVDPAAARTCIPVVCCLVVCCLVVPVVLVGHRRGVPAQGGRSSPQCGAQDGAQGVCQQGGAPKLPQQAGGQHGGFWAAGKQTVRTRETQTQADNVFYGTSIPVAGQRPVSGMPAMRIMLQHTHPNPSWRAVTSPPRVFEAKTPLAVIHAANRAPKLLENLKYACCPPEDEHALLAGPQRPLQQHR